MIRVGLALLALAGCSTFEDPDVVIDLRILAITATPPEQVIEVDLSGGTPNPTQLLQQLVTTQVCALVTDPGLERRLRYRFLLCVYGDDARCDPDVMVALASGVVADPDTSPTAQSQICATIAPNGNLLGVLTETLKGDPFAGLGGLDYLVQLVVGGEDADPALDQYAAKTLKVAPKIPDARKANANPTLDAAMPIIATVGDTEVALPMGRCVDQAQPFEIRANTRLKLTPTEIATSREAYVLPTIDGKMMMFTESLTYQWLATAGGFSQGETGGTRDGFGNSPDLFTEYRAPNGGDLGGPTDIQLWIIQRDERYGATWYETCVRVVP